MNDERAVITLRANLREQRNRVRSRGQQLLAPEQHPLSEVFVTMFPKPFHLRRAVEMR
jgi:hypothetical protein